MAGYADQNITISLFLQARPADGADFNTVLLLVDLATNSLNGSRQVLYEDYQGMVDDQAAGYISTDTLEAGRQFFAQPGSLAKLRVGYVDIGGGEGYDDGLAAVIADAGARTFWGIAINTLVAADIEEVSAAVEALDFYFFVAQTDDVGWYTAGYPAGFTALEGRERTAVCWHDGDLTVAGTADWMALTFLANRLAWDPDDQIANWTADLSEIAEYATPLTTAQKAFALGNEVNLVTRWGSAVSWLDQGINCNNRPIDHMLSSDWFVDTLDATLATYVVRMSGFGLKITVDARGQAMVQGQIDSVIKAGKEAGHFLDRSPVDDTIETGCTPETITTADVTARRLRYTAVLILSTGAIEFVVNAYASQT